MLGPPGLFWFIYMYYVFIDLGLDWLYYRFSWVLIHPQRCWFPLQIIKITIFGAIEISLMYKIKSSGPKAEQCGHPKWNLF